jgi:hypothetical protein
MITENEWRLWGRHDNQQFADVVQHNDIRHNNKYTATLSIRSVVMLLLSVIYANVVYAECRK